ncbi:MAG: hypothetical protein ABUT20_40375, partial [Bacteroidota bacterium]
MFFFNNYFYFFTIVLQVICAIHCIRRGNQGNWIWLIIFLPLVGSLIYIFTEMFSTSDLKNVQTGFGNALFPGSRIKKLEKNLHFTDTFNNRVALADAYLATGQTGKAIDLYKSSLTGNFTENEYVLCQLIIAYFQTKQYDELIPIAQKIYKLPQFARSRQHIYYAMALSYTGQQDLAEKEFKLMKTRFSNYEARYQYARLMAANKRTDEARQLLNEIISEASHLSPRERRYNSNWFALAKE